jgi:hypothetical protein
LKANTLMHIRKQTKKVIIIIVTIIIIVITIAIPITQIYNNNNDFINTNLRCY